MIRNVERVRLHNILARVSKKERNIIVLALVGMVILAIPFLVTREYVHLLTMMGFWMIGAASLRLLMITGRLSLGQSFFVAVGAYASAILAVKAGWTPWLGMVVGAVAATLIAWLIGLVILRVPGVYFAIITMAILMVIESVVRLTPGLTGGATGLTGIPEFTIGSLRFELTHSYYLMLFIVAISLLVMYLTEHSPFGLLARSLGDNDELAEHLGVNMQKYRMIAFCIGALFSGLAGAFYAHYIRYVSLDAFGLTLAFNLQIYAIVGGMGAFWGPLAGVLSLETLIHFLRVARWVQPIIYGTILLLFFIFIRGGIVEAVGRIRSRWRKAFANKNTGNKQPQLGRRNGEL